MLLFAALENSFLLLGLKESHTKQYKDVDCLHMCLMRRHTTLIRIMKGGIVMKTTIF